MKIRLALLDKDSGYLKRLVSALNNKYSDDFEIYSFTDKECALQKIASSKIDVFIADADSNVDIEKLPAKCSFAYFTPDSSIERIHECKAIGKYLKTDSVYKEILGLYAEKAGDWDFFLSADGKSKMIVFSSPCGGAGTSTIAAACAIHFANAGKKVLYLNFEKYGCPDVFFPVVGDNGILDNSGESDLEKIIRGLRKKLNLSILLNSRVRDSKYGVCFHSHPKCALHVSELSFEDMSKIITEEKRLNKYDYIILDMDFNLSKASHELYKMFNYIIWCSDGSDTNNSKVERAYDALCITEKNDDYQIADRIRLIYNKHTGSGKTVAADGIRCIGSIPCFEWGEYSDLLNKCAKSDVFDELSK